MLACINSVILAAVEYQRYVCNMIVNMNAGLYLVSKGLLFCVCSVANLLFY